ncbi:MAG: mechanosensitive ion channel, partial [Pseudomonadales bacterium]|nr:mechanosensitive ion channel [Pseudomonadales bacterium]
MEKSLEAVLNETLAQMEVAVSRTANLSELAIIGLVYLLAYFLARKASLSLKILREPPANPKQYPLRHFVFRCGKLVFPLLAIVLLRVVIEFSSWVIADGWVMQIALIIAILLIFYSFSNVVINNPIVSRAFRIVGLPLLFLHLVGVLGDIVNFLDSIAIQMGDIRISAYGLSRMVIFGSLLFWLGRISNSTGQTIIRRQASLDFRTREVLAKLFEIGLFFIIFILILQVMGINLTALAVFGGAVGVGLGLGLQSIASNFISGIIILLDRSVSLGDYIQLEDGGCGTVTEQSMRSTTLETYDGKDIVVPNEKFITGAFVNWTHKNKKQRYRVDFSVAYHTDVRSMVGLIKDIVASHPSVLSGDSVPFEERPDCEIDSFGDHGIN